MGRAPPQWSASIREKSAIKSILDLLAHTMRRSIDVPGRFTPSWEGMAMTPRIYLSLPLAAPCQSLGRRVYRQLTMTRPEFSSLKVDVVNEGIIRLSGSVTSFHSRQLAISAARRVTGVQNIVDEIRVPVRTLGHSSQSEAEPARAP